MLKFVYDIGTMIQKTGSSRSSKGRTQKKWMKTSSRLSSPPKGVELVEINKTERERNKVKILFIGWWIEPD